MKLGKYDIGPRIFSSIGKLLRTKENLSFAQIRLSHIIYLLPFALIIMLLDSRNLYFLPKNNFMGIDALTTAYASYAVGTITVLLFFMKKHRMGFRIFTVLAASCFLLWLILPEGDFKTLAMFLVQFGIGGGAAYAVYAHVFVLNNAERLLSTFLVTLNYGFIFLRGDGPDALYSIFLPAVLISILTFCVFRFQPSMLSNPSDEVSIEPPKSIYICLTVPFAFHTIQSFGEVLVNNFTTGSNDVRGIGLIVAVLLALVIQFGFRRNVWYMLNFFLVFTLLGTTLIAIPANPDVQSIGKLLFGMGDGLGFMTTFYIIGMIKKYRNFKFFWIITTAVTLELIVAILAADSVFRFWQDALSLITIGVTFLYLCFVMFFSPAFQRNIFDSDWIDDFSKPDMTYIMKKIDEVDKFAGLKLSPREKEVTLLLLRGLTARQIAASIGVMESTVNGYCKTLYRKLNINSRMELFARFGIIEDHREVGIGFKPE